MKTVVSFEFGGPTIQHNGLTPRTLLDREYVSRSDAFIPAIGEIILIQWGEDAAQSNYFVVDKVSHELWRDKDCVTVYLGYES